MEKRLFLMMGISLLILVVSQPFLSKYMKQPEPLKKPGQPNGVPTGTAPSVVPSILPASPAIGEVKTVAVQASAETETVVENDLYRIAFSNRGAQVKSWILKKYNNDSGKGNPLDLVHSVAAPLYGYPLSLYTYNETRDKKLAQALYVSSATGKLVPPATVTFEYADGETTVRKSFRFDDSYVVRIEASVMDKGAMVAALPAWPAGFGDQTIPSSYLNTQVAWDSPEKVSRLDQKKVAGGDTIHGPFRWASVADPYFAAVFLPDDENSAALVTLRNTIGIPKDPAKPDPNDMEKEPVLGAAIGNLNGITRERLFVGPKAMDVLAAVHSGPHADERSLDNLVDYGFFHFVARPLFLWLRWTHEHWVANWGWSILVLTLVINIVMLPLRISTMKSSMKMMKLQPQIAAITEKYKKYKLTDPRMADKNKEVAELYKQGGANPVGGCLPTILQLPFMYAFYTMLQTAIELRQADFLWIKDLSSADPLHLIPLLFVSSMFFMQKLTPQGGMDPAQQKMMTFMMPLFMGFICWRLAAGLGIYWMAGNILGIVQQLAMNRTQFGREMRAHMESRGRKK